MSDRVLGIFGTATRPAYRRRGVQSAIVTRALNDARGSFDLAIATTEPGSISQRTFERFGFQVLYTRAILVSLRRERYHDDHDVVPRVLTRTRALIALSLLLLVAGIDVPTQSQSLSASRRRSSVRREHRRRLLSRHLHAARGVLEDARPRVRSHAVWWTSAGPRKAAPSGWRSSRAPENLAEARSLPGDLASPVARRRPDRRPGARARRRGQGGRLDRWRAARQRSARRAAADRDGLSAGQPDGRRDAALSPRRDRPGGHANPDGHELVANWYMRERDPVLRTLAGVPRAYQKYVGHDNNRDFYLSSQAETINMNRVLYREWFPQIVYDHHQTGPAGTVMFAPPFRDPFNYVFDPLIPAGIDLVGAAMHTRFALEGKPGVTMRSGSTYSTWWNGGLRTTAYFHNQIGLLTETIGSPTPDRDSVRARAAAAERRSAVSDRAAAVAFPPVDRLFGDGEPRGARRRLALSRDAALQHLPDGEERHRARQPGHLDDLAASHRSAAGVGARGAAVARLRAAAARRRSCAIRAATSCRRISRTFLTATKFVDALLKNGRHRSSRDGRVRR